MFLALMIIRPPRFSLIYILFLRALVSRSLALLISPPGKKTKKKNIAMGDTSVGVKSYHS